MAGLILKRASASRPSGRWNEDDFDPLEVKNTLVEWMQGRIYAVITQRS
jgi:hypothetical protein